MKVEMRSDLDLNYLDSLREQPFFLVPPAIAPSRPQCGRIQLDKQRKKQIQYQVGKESSKYQTAWGKQNIERTS